MRRWARSGSSADDPAAVEDRPQHGLGTLDEVLVAHEHAALGWLGAEGRQRKSVREPQIGVDAQLRKQATGAFALAHEPPDRGHDRLRVAHQEHQAQLEPRHVLQFARAQGEVGGVDHVLGAGGRGDGREQPPGEAAVGALQGPAPAHRADPQDRRGALEQAVGGVAVQLLRVGQGGPHRRPEAGPLEAAEDGCAAAGEIAVELAGEEEALAVAQRHPEDRRSAVAGAHHVDGAGAPGARLPTRAAHALARSAGAAGERGRHLGGRRTPGARRRSARAAAGSS